jgi:hypothetical protein
MPKLFEYAIKIHNPFLTTSTCNISRRSERVLVARRCRNRTTGHKFSPGPEASPNDDMSQEITSSDARAESDSSLCLVVLIHPGAPTGGRRHRSWSVVESRPPEDSFIIMRVKFMRQDISYPMLWVDHDSFSRYGRAAEMGMGIAKAKANSEALNAAVARGKKMSRYSSTRHPLPS